MNRCAQVARSVAKHPERHAMAHVDVGSPDRASARVAPVAASNRAEHASMPCERTGEAHGATAGGFHVDAGDTATCTRCGAHRFGDLAALRSFAERHSCIGGAP